jgi:hypothetical protein
MHPVPGPNARLTAAQGSEIVLTDEVECFWLSGASGDRGLLLPELRRSPSQVPLRVAALVTLVGSYVSRGRTSSGTFRGLLSTGQAVVSF